MEIFASNLKNIPNLHEEPYLVHNVKKGETVTKVAKRYGISKNELADANNISTKSKLYAGVQLKIPVITNPNSTSLWIILILKLPRIKILRLEVMVML